VKTLVLTPDFPPSRGGIQVLVHRLVTHATGLESRVLTLGPGAEAAEFDRATGVDVRRVGTRLGGRQAAVAKLNVVALAEALRQRPQLVLSAHIVVSPAAAIIRRALRIPVVQYLYAKEIGARPGLARFAVRNADALIAISRYTHDLALGVGADPGRMALIPPGVDLPESHGVEDPPEADGRPRLVTVARLEDRYKGHDVIARSLPLVRARVPEVEWVVVGDGPLRTHLEQLVRANGVADSVRFVGSVSDAERDRWLRSADVFAMPSRLPARGLAGEGFGIVYLEANARGVPVVAGGVAGALDAVVDGETGLLVDADDHFSVAEAVSALLLDRDWAKAIGEAGVGHSQRFAWPAIAERVERLCRRVTEAGALR
jgi:glycosyltransferase involved in cell wall biosynthesis